MLLAPGDIIELPLGVVVNATVPKHFLYSNHKGDFTLDHGQVCIQTELEYLSGTYVVYKTKKEDGGKDHVGQRYADGHHIFCEKLDNRSIKVDFYETGDLMPKVKHIKKCGKAVLQWVVQ